MDECVHVEEVAVGEEHEKEQPSTSEQAEENTGADAKSEVLPDEKPGDKAGLNGDQEALFLDDRDALELVFRYALTDEATTRSAGTLIKRIFALRDTFARDAIVRVMKRLSNVRFGGGLVTLVKDKETAVVTVAQFAWMMRWDTLRFDKFDISSHDKAGCAGLIKVADLFQLRELKYLTGQYPSSVGLAFALVKNNVNTLKVLDRVPVWHFKEPLPALHLDRFVYRSGWGAPSAQDMGNLAQCTIAKFEYSFARFHNNIRLPLSFLADVHCTEVHWDLRAFCGFESPLEGQANVHTRKISIEAEAESWHIGVFLLRSLDIETLRRFFPSLLRIDLHVLAYYGDFWMVDNVMRFFAKVQQFSQALASAQGEFALEQSVLMSFKRLSDDDHTSAATKKAIELGFTPEVANGTTVFKRQVEVAPGRIVTAVCTLT